MSYCSITVHCVWPTRNRVPVLLPEKRVLIEDHIRTYAPTRKIYIDTIGGHLDHMHCLLTLNGAQSMGDVMKLIKGESAYWANSQGIFDKKFHWASDYFAGAVNLRGISKVRAYIRNQEEHHRKITFEEEYNLFIESHGLKRFGKNGG